MPRSWYKIGIDSPGGDKWVGGIVMVVAQIYQYILDNVPDNASVDGIWAQLGWTAAEEYPVFLDVVDFRLPWGTILRGADDRFYGSTPKLRLLQALDTLMDGYYLN
jgi:hypothetical protein